MGGPILNAGDLCLNVQVLQQNKDYLFMKENFAVVLKM